MLEEPQVNLLECSKQWATWREMGLKGKARARFYSTLQALDLDLLLCAWEVFARL